MKRCRGSHCILYLIACLLATPLIGCDEYSKYAKAKTGSEDQADQESQDNEQNPEPGNRRPGENDRNDPKPAKGGDNPANKTSPQTDPEPKPSETPAEPATPESGDGTPPTPAFTRTQPLRPRERVVIGRQNPLPGAEQPQVTIDPDAVEKINARIEKLEERLDAMPPGLTAEQRQTIETIRKDLTAVQSGQGAVESRVSSLEETQTRQQEATDALGKLPERLDALETQVGQISDSLKSLQETYNEKVLPQLATLKGLTERLQATEEHIDQHLRPMGERLLELLDAMVENVREKEALRSELARFRKEVDRNQADLTTYKSGVDKILKNLGVKVDGLFTLFDKYEQFAELAVQRINGHGRTIDEMGELLAMIPPLIREGLESTSRAIVLAEESMALNRTKLTGLEANFKRLSSAIQRLADEKLDHGQYNAMLTHIAAYHADSLQLLAEGSFDHQARAESSRRHPPISSRFGDLEPFAMGATVRGQFASHRHKSFTELYNSGTTIRHWLKKNRQRKQKDLPAILPAVDIDTAAAYIVARLRQPVAGENDDLLYGLEAIVAAVDRLTVEPRSMARTLYALGMARALLPWSQARNLAETALINDIEVALWQVAVGARGPRATIRDEAIYGLTLAAAAAGPRSATMKKLYKYTRRLGGHQFAFLQEMGGSDEWARHVQGQLQRFERTEHGYDADDQLRVYHAIQRIEWQLYEDYGWQLGLIYSKDDFMDHVVPQFSVYASAPLQRYRMSHAGWTDLYLNAAPVSYANEGDGYISPDHYLTIITQLYRKATEEKLAGRSIGRRAVAIDVGGTMINGSWKAFFEMQNWNKEPRMENKPKARQRFIVFSTHDLPDDDGARGRFFDQFIRVPKSR